MDLKLLGENVEVLQELGKDHETRLTKVERAVWLANRIVDLLLKALAAALGTVLVIKLTGAFHL